MRQRNFQISQIGMGWRVWEVFYAKPRLICDIETWRTQDTAIINAESDGLLRVTAQDAVRNEGEIVFL